MAHQRPHFRAVYYSKISINRAVIISFLRTIDRGLPTIRDDAAIVIPYAMRLSSIVLANTDNKKPA